MKTRAGLTLIETLIAIFIMSIGMLCLLTLFPVGAFSMANALRDQRIQEAGQQAKTTADMRDVRNDTLAAYQNGFSSASLQRPALPNGWTGPSYPVFADPWGVTIGSPAFVGTWNNATGAGRVTRTNLSFANSRATAALYCGLQDELTFNDDGTPDVSNGLQREPKITWAYWARRPNNSIPNVVDLSIVVFHDRNLLLAATDTQYTNFSFNANTPTAVSINANLKPEARRGQWLVDMTANNPRGNANQVAAAMKNGPVQGNWYRITEVVEAIDRTTGTDIVVLELSPQPQVAIQSFVVMDGVAEVIPLGTGWK
jgi:hypothetical protein